MPAAVFRDAASAAADSRSRRDREVKRPLAPRRGRRKIPYAILINPSDRIRKLLAIAQLDRLFTIYDSLETALQGEK